MRGLAALLCLLSCARVGRVVGTALRLDAQVSQAAAHRGEATAVQRPLLPGRGRRAVGQSHTEYSFGINGSLETALTARLWLGTPLQEFNVLLDTGSSNLAVAAYENPNVTHRYREQQSRTGETRGDPFRVNYVAAWFEAARVVDLVRFGNLTSSPTFQAEFGAITASHKFFQAGIKGPTSTYDGILGLAYQSIAEPEKLPIVPLFDRVRADTDVPDVFTVSMCWTPPSGAVGSLVLGGIGTDFSLSPADYQFARQLYAGPGGGPSYYSVLVTSMALDGQPLALSCGEYNSPAPSIVDTGTTNLRVPEHVHATLVQTVRPSFERHRLDLSDEFYQGTSCIRDLSTRLIDSLPDLTIGLLSSGDASKEVVITVPPSIYLRTVTIVDKGHQDGTCSFFGITPQCMAGSGITIGLVALMQTSVTFQRDSKRIGFATIPTALCHATSGPAPPAVIVRARAGGQTGLCRPLDNVTCSAAAPSQQFPVVALVGVAAGVLVLLVGVIAALICWPRDRDEDGGDEMDDLLVGDGDDDQMIELPTTLQALDRRAGREHDAPSDSDA